MTPEQSKNFIEKVLKGNWPKLVETEVDIEGWAKRLWRFDYGKAKKCLEDFKFRRTRQGIPPAGLIMAAMKPAVLPKEVTGGEPVSLYTIIRPDGRPAGHPVASARGIPADIEAVQRGAEALCARLAGDREGYCIQWLCEAVAPSTPF